MSPKLQGIDHVHVYVADRTKAAQWYNLVMGFTINAEFESWANDPLGPLTIEDSSGQIHLALFQREQFHPASTIAFRASGEDFLEWKQLLESQGLSVRCSDHDLAWSMYFSDPDGNAHEITTYDHEIIRAELNV
ncbi:MAG: VOC family protein [Cellvibrionaceae bacterium]